MIIEVQSEAQTKALGKKVGTLLKGGEVIELVGDVGAGKTTFTKGLAEGLGIDEDVQSPSFTISRVYDADRGLRLSHYDFYRLQDAGIMANELEETLHDSKMVTIIEWAEIITGVLPADRLTITITATADDEQARHIAIVSGGAISQVLLGELA
jgi:tRNA threonylcarbamoyladenosine biosynthesis protein TsaE